MNPDPTIGPEDPETSGDTGEDCGALPEPGSQLHELTELRGELAAAGAESRRTARRQMEVLKEFGAAIDAVGRMVRDLHTAAREPVTKSPAPSSVSREGAEALLLPLIEMADRLARAADAFRAPPAAAGSWWPGERRATAPWRSAWASQKDGLFILLSQMDTLLARAGLERLPAAGRLFDPSCMTAVEVVTDATLPDHTVVEELLGGWRSAATGRLVRSAQVRVSRLP